MASMGYSHDTLQELMGLVDEHKESLTEASYLQICNAIKDLHKGCAVATSPPRGFHSLQRSDTVPDPLEQYQQVLDERRHLLAVQRRIASYEDALQTSVPGNVKLIDKVQVLRTFGYVGPDRLQDVSAYAKQLKQNRVVAAIDLKYLYQTRKTERYIEWATRINNDLDIARQEERNSKQRLTRAINNYASTPTP